MARDYVALLDHLNIDKAHVVGWSDGANIGYALSMNHPERIASHFAHAGNVTLEGIKPTVESEEIFGIYGGMMATDYMSLAADPGGFENFMAGVVEMWNSEKPGGLKALNSVTTPTLVVHSQHDEAIKADHADHIAAAIPGAKLITMDNVSHFALLQDPDEYNAAIRRFLDSL